MNALPLVPPSAMRRVLLLEDHTLLRTTMVRALSEIPQTCVVGVATLKEALSEISSRRPDLVVSDLQLADGSGLELIPRLAVPPASPIMFVSAHVARFESQLGRYPGVLVLDKPLPARTLRFIASEQLGLGRARSSPFATGDYIQLACVGRHSVRIDACGPSGRGSVFIVSGRLWAAVSGRLQGVAALRQLLFTHGARVSSGATASPPDEPNLPDVPWEHLLLDLARHVDEGTQEMSAVGTQETPAADADCVAHQDAVDFSDVFDESLSSTTGARVSDDAVARSSFSPLPPPPFQAAEKRPTTLTMRALNGDSEREDRQSDGTFAVAFDEAVRAYLFRDYEAALGLFEEALLQKPNEPRCVKNIAVLKSRLGRGKP